MKSQNADDIFAEMASDFSGRKFVAGLLIALLRFFRDLDAVDGAYPDFEAFAARYPVQDRTSRDTRANTLIVRKDETTTLSIRPYYNAIERYFRADQKRFDYPNMAPHATQAWRDYSRWFDGILGLSRTASEELENRVIKFVLNELPSHDIDPSTLKAVPRRFSIFLEEFEFEARRDEPRGAAFQGAVYAYIRADAPHLQLDVAKSGAGSRRLQKVGDIDGWDGERLILSVEVKHFRIDSTNESELAAFCNEITRRQALGVVAAQSFDDAARVSLNDRGMRTIEISDLVWLVDLWDPLKQEAALSAFAYYVHHVQQRSSLISRFQTFMENRFKAP